MSDATPPRHDSSPGSARTEKLHAIAAVFGSDIAAQLASIRPGEASDEDQGGSLVDRDRVAWHQNRLIQHLRDRAAPPKVAAPPTSATGLETPPLDQKPARIKPALARLHRAAKQNDIAGEHPAIIAHILKAEPQSVRVGVLKRLPGRTARAVMQRLRSD